MTATTTTADGAPTPTEGSAQPAERTRSIPRAGWMVIARKEFGDHLLSSRFIVLLLILGLAVGIPIFLATEQITSIASEVSGIPALFIALSAALYMAGLGFAILRLLVAMPFAWLAVVGGFSLLGWIANEMADPDRSLGAQYGGLALAVVAQSLVFSPLFAYASLVAPEVLPQAAILTGIAFAGLTGYTLTTRKDFSFLRAGLCVASMIALGLIVLSVA